MIEEIKRRRSIRSYKNQKVSEADLKEIVQCGVMAPSGMNTQGVEFCVITNENVLNTLEELAGRSFFYHAPALIVVYANPDNRFGVQDGSCALTQMYLAAHSLGLGSCWINQLKDFETEERFSSLFEDLGLKGKKIIGALSVGVAADSPKEKEIKPNRVHYVK